MTALDWIIVVAYIAGIIAMGYYIGLRQKNQDDYYLGGRKVTPFLAGASLMANQVSAVSLISVPAFIALRPGGGLRWLQYELAVPIAMAFIILFLVPVYRKTRGVTIYEYLGQRFGARTQEALSLVFLISRSMGAGVILLATSYVTAALLGLELSYTILLIGFFAMIYTSMGGIVADIYSDLLQLAILWGGSILCLVILVLNVDFTVPPTGGDMSRFEVFRFTSTGLGDGDTFSFWPMLIGGFFLYVSYYGCDQSQAQRIMSTAGEREAGRALLINGMVRFPLVATYCAVGLLMIPFLQLNPGFSAVAAAGHPDYLMPLFFMNYVPSGARGFIIAGIIAASMSSIDSAVNSLSASTWHDLLGRRFGRLLSLGDREKVRLARVISVAWGCAATLFGLMMAGSSDTVIELINKIGSAFYGPIAGLFFTGIMFRRVPQKYALAGFMLGICTNILLWLCFTGVSWMWWNLTGFASTVTVAVVPVLFTQGRRIIESDPAASLPQAPTARGAPALLLGWFVIILIICVITEFALSRSG